MPRKKINFKWSLFSVDQLIYQRLENGFSYDEATGEIYSDEDLESIIKDGEDSYILYIKNLESQIEQMKVQVRTFQKRIRIAQAKDERLKEALIKHMELTGKKKLVNAQYAVSTRVSHPLVIDDESAIIAKRDSIPNIVKTEYKVNKTEIKKNLDELKDYAHLDNKTNITIK